MWTVALQLPIWRCLMEELAELATSRRGKLWRKRGPLEADRGSAFADVSATPDTIGAVRSTEYVRMRGYP